MSRNVTFKGYELFIFDFDYTLFDTSKGVILCIKDALCEYGINISDDEIKSGIGVSLNEFFMRYTRDLNIVEQMKKTFLERSSQVMVELTEPYPTTFYTINELHHRGCRLAVCTGKFRDRVKRTLEKHHILNRFDLLVCGDEYTKSKPDPEGLIKCLDYFIGINRENIAYVGDHYYDIIAAQSCGIDSIAITSGSIKKDGFLKYNPTHIIEDLAELLLDLRQIFYFDFTLKNHLL